MKTRLCQTASKMDCGASWKNSNSRLTRFHWLSFFQSYFLLQIMRKSRSCDCYIYVVTSKLQHFKVQGQMVVFGLYSCRQKYESNVVHKSNSFIEKIILIMFQDIILDTFISFLLKSLEKKIIDYSSHNCKISKYNSLSI